MRDHQPRSPEWSARDYLAAQIMANQPQQGRSLLCNGVILFDDEGELRPDSHAVIPGHCPARAPCPRPPEPVTTSWTAYVKAQRAKENRDYVRKLLSRQQPEFADALAAAEQELTCQADLPRPRNAPAVRML